MKRLALVNLLPKAKFILALVVLVFLALPILACWILYGLCLMIVGWPLQYVTRVIYGDELDMR